MNPGIYVEDGISILPQESGRFLRAIDVVRKHLPDFADQSSTYVKLFGDQHEGATLQEGKYWYLAESAIGHFGKFISDPRVQRSAHSLKMAAIMKRKNEKTAEAAKPATPAFTVRPMEFYRSGHTELSYAGYEVSVNPDVVFQIIAVGPRKLIRSKDVLGIVIEPQQLHGTRKALKDGERVQFAPRGGNGQYVFAERKCFFNSDYVNKRPQHHGKFKDALVLLDLAIEAVEDFERRNMIAPAHAAPAPTIAPAPAAPAPALVDPAEELRRRVEVQNAGREQLRKDIAGDFDAALMKHTNAILDVVARREKAMIEAFMTRINAMQDNVFELIAEVQDLKAQQVREDVTPPAPANDIVAGKDKPGFISRLFTR